MDGTCRVMEYNHNNEYLLIHYNTTWKQAFEKNSYPHNALLVTYKEADEEGDEEADEERIFLETHQIWFRCWRRRSAIWVWNRWIGIKLIYSLSILSQSKKALVQSYSKNLIIFRMLPYKSDQCVSGGFHHSIVIKDRMNTEN